MIFRYETGTLFTLKLFLHLEFLPFLKMLVYDHEDIFLRKEWLFKELSGDFEEKVVEVSDHFRVKSIWAVGPSQSYF